MRIDFTPQLNRNPLMAIGAGLGAVGAIGKFIFGAKQRKEGKRINPIFNQYQTSPYAKQQLGIAQQMFGGRMPGAQQLERNIYANQANALGGLSRNATDSSQLLSLGAQAQGQSNDAFQNLGIAEAQNKQAMLQNLNQAYGGMINEGDKSYQSMLQKFQMDTQQKNALMGGGATNMTGGLGDLASLGIMGGQMGWFGGNGGGGGQQSPQLGDGGVGTSWQTNANRNFRKF